MASAALRVVSSAAAGSSPRVHAPVVASRASRARSTRTHTARGAASPSISAASELPMGDGWDAQLADAFRDCPETRALVTGDLVTLRPCELCPELPMWLLDDGDDVLTLWERTETFAGGTASSSHGASDGGLCPPYWAVPWVGGQGLARYILDNPDVVRGRSVLDVGSGCGVAALAAATAGASRVCGEFILIYFRTGN